MENGACTATLETESSRDYHNVKLIDAEAVFVIPKL